MQKSIIVHGKTLAAALEKGSVLLHCPIASVGHEILSPQSTSRDSRTPDIIKLRVFTLRLEGTDFAAQRDRSKDPFAHLPVPQPETLKLDCQKFLQALDDLTDSVVAGNFASESADDTNVDSESNSALVHQVQGDLLPDALPESMYANLVVAGNVATGVRLNVHGSITVLGEAFDCNLRSTYDITIHGCARGTIVSERGTVTVAAADSATIRSMTQSVQIAGDCLDSDVYARTTLKIEGVVTGGKCYAEQLLVVKSAGSFRQDVTILYAGANLRITKEIDSIRELAVATIQTLGEARKEREVLILPEQSNAPQTPETRSRLWRCCAVIAECNSTLLNLARQKSALLGMINSERGARICASNKIFPRVKVIIDDCPIDVTSPIHFVSFSKDFDSGNIRIAPFS